MRYFDQTLVANHREHREWWGELQVNREHFHRSEAAHAALMSDVGFTVNAAAVLPRDAWLEMDNITRRVMRADEGQVWMADLMPLAKPVSIGKLVHLTRVASDSSAPVNRSMSGQVPNAMDKTVYDYRGTPVPIFSTGYGREWREWNSLSSESFDALSDDQESTTARADLDTLMRAVRDLFHNRPGDLVVTGGRCDVCRVNGPMQSPTTDPSLIGRRVSIRLDLVNT